MAPVSFITCSRASLRASSTFGSSGRTGGVTWMFMAASNGLRSADVGREGPVTGTGKRTHPFAGMTRIRFDGSEEKPLSQPLDCDPPENEAQGDAGGGGRQAGASV